MIWHVYIATITIINWHLSTCIATDFLCVVTFKIYILSATVTYFSIVRNLYPFILYIPCYMMRPLYWTNVNPVMQTPTPAPSSCMYRIPSLEGSALSSPHLDILIPLKFKTTCWTLHRSSSPNLGCQIPSRNALHVGHSLT